MILSNRPGLGLAATLGFSALLMGFAGMSSARADDWDRYGRGNVYAGFQDVRRDEQVLRDLEYRRDEARRCRRWDEARSLDFEIRDLRHHIDRDRREIHVDIRLGRDRFSYDERRRVDDRRDDRYRNDRRRDDRTRYRTDDGNGRYDRYNR